MEGQTQQVSATNGLANRSNGLSIQPHSPASNKLRDIMKGDSPRTVSLSQIRDMLHPKAQPMDFTEAQMRLETAYGTEYSQQRIDSLFEQIHEAGWSGERLLATTKWLIRTKPWVAWAISDFFNAPSAELNNHAWVQEQCREDRNAMLQMQGYRVGEVVLYRWYAPEPLPFALVWDRGESLLPKPTAAPDLTPPVDYSAIESQKISAKQQEYMQQAKDLIEKAADPVNRMREARPLGEIVSGKE